MWDNEALSTWRCRLLVLEESLPRNWQMELLDPGPSTLDASDSNEGSCCNGKRWNKEAEDPSWS